jgi:hypothetical protein
MSKRLTQVMVLLVTCALASADAVAAVSAATLHGNGGVSVNGNAVMPITTVFGGDRIETAPNSAASLTMNGSSVLVGQNSNLIYNGPGVSFSSGRGVIQTSQGLGAKFAGVAITPNQPAAKFQLEQKGDILTVAALEGSLSIADGANVISLNPGQQVDVDLKAKDRKKAGGADVPSSPSQAGSVSGTVSQGVSAGTVMAASGTVMAVAITGIIAVSQKPISPSGP